MRKLLSKRIISAMAIVFMLAFCSAPVSAANKLTFAHGNDNTAKKCLAKTSQTGSDSIGALITWQLTNKNEVHYAKQTNSSGASTTCYSSKLKGKSGQSYGYFYRNGEQVHKSTAWYSFSF